MQSSNPVLSKRDSFTSGYASFNAPPSDRSPSYDAPPMGGYSPPPVATGGRMTMDDVIVKTAVTLGVLFAGAAVGWVLVPDSVKIPVLFASLLAGLGLYFVVAFKRSISPALVLAYAGVEGVLLGIISSVFEDQYNGIVTQAVLGTGLVFAATLAAYKSGRIRVTPRFTRIVIIAGFAAMGLMLVNLLASVFGVADGSGLGLRSGGTLSIVFGLAMVVLGAFFLILDFDLVDKGIAQGAPERESWRAAFGLTVTLVWIYLEILRLISYFRE